MPGVRGKLLRRECIGIETRGKERAINDKHAVGTGKK